MGLTSRQPRRLNRSQIQEILERNMQLYRNEENAATYLVELALYLLEYEYDWADAPERAPASTKEQMGTVGRGEIVEVKEPIAVKESAKKVVPAESPAEAVVAAPTAKPEQTDKNQAGGTISSSKKPPVAGEQVAAPVPSFEDAWEEINRGGKESAGANPRKVTAALGNGGGAARPASPVGARPASVAARQAAVQAAEEPVKVPGDNRFISPDLRKMTTKYGTMTNRCPHCGTAIDRETLCPACKNLVR